MARAAVDVAGLGVVCVETPGRLAWRSPQTALWLHALGAAVLGETMRLLPLHEEGAAALARLTEAALTPRETEVLS